MPAGKCQHSAEPKRTALFQPISPLLVPSKVLLRRIFFIDMCEKMCSDEQYTCENCDFRLSTTRGYNTARLNLGDSYIVYGLKYIQCLLRIFYVVRMQEMRCLEAMPHVMKYATNALIANRSCRT
jgi:hypothetical protein